MTAADRTPPGQLPRRRFCAGFVGALASYAALDALFTSEALAAGATGPRELARELLQRVDAFSRAARQGRLNPRDWQRDVEAALAAAPLAELRDGIRFDRLSSGFARGGKARAVILLGDGELPGPAGPLSFRTKLFCLRRGRAVVPHGHDNLLSAFHVLGGRLRGRHFDRVRDEPDAVVIRPTIDREFAPGDGSSISDDRDNVHWFTATSERAYMLNVRLAVPGRGRARRRGPGRVYLDPEGERLEGDLIRAPRSSVRALRDRYEG